MTTSIGNMFNTTSNNIKFSIIIPFRPKAESIDWERESRLLSQTITSVLRQTFSAFKVFVLYTDQPSELIEHEKIAYVEFPGGHQSYEAIVSEIQIKKNGGAQVGQSTQAHLWL